MSGLAVLLPTLGIWRELVLADKGVNGFGGDTAEIYLYRLMGYLPTVVHRRDGTSPLDMPAFQSAEEAAVLALLDICALFEHEHSCRVLWEGETLDVARAQAYRYSHRIHVRVVNA